MAHLTTQEVTSIRDFWRRINAIAPLCSWDRDPFSTTPLKNMTWYNREDEPEVRVDWFTIARTISGRGSEDTQG